MRGESIAEVRGLKLWVGRIRPGRRECVQTEMHRDVVTLARNRAVSDAVIVSAEEDLAEIVTEVQDLGMRVAVVHITVDGNSTMSRPLRQECDDIVDISGAHLRPFVDLIAGAEPADREEQYSNGSYPARSHEAQSHEARSYEPRSFETPTYQRMGLANGHGAGLGAVTHQGLPAAALPAPPTIYTAPVVEEYQRTADPTGPGLMGRDSMGRDSIGTGSADARSMGPCPPAPASPPAPPPAPRRAARGRARPSRGWARPPCRRHLFRPRCPSRPVPGMCRSGPTQGSTGRPNKSDRARACRSGKGRSGKARACGKG